MAIEQAVVAEKNGFDTLWISDHFVDLNGERLEPWSVLSAVAVRTRRIRLASDVTGAGEATSIVPFGLPVEFPRQRVVRLAEAIQVIKTFQKQASEFFR